MEINKEMLKGHIDTMILFLLSNGDQYGYQIVKQIKERTDDQFEMKEATLYMSLKRLEKNEYVTFYWGDEPTGGGKRKYYSLTSVGKAFMNSKLDEWFFLEKLLNCFYQRGNLK